MSELTFPDLLQPDAPVEVIDAKPVGALATLREHTMQPLSAVERGITALRTEHGSTNYDVTTPAGYRLARLRRAAVREVRYQVPKIVKAKKEELAGLREQVEEEGARITELLREIEDPHDRLIEAEDDRKRAIKAEADKYEEARKETHRSGIANIRCYLDRCQAPGMTSDRVAAGIAALSALTFGPEWEEFAVPAANAQCETLEAMRKVQAQLLGREIEAERQDAIRVENLRVAAEQQAERERIAAETAELRRQAEELQRQAAELAAQRAESERLERLAEERRAVAQFGAAQASSVEAAATPGAIMDTTPGPAAIEQAPPTVDTAGPPECELAPTLTMAQINSLLGPLISTNHAALVAAGVKRQPRQGVGVHFLHTDWPAIKAAIIKHVEGLA